MCGAQSQGGLLHPGPVLQRRTRPQRGQQDCALKSFLSGKTQEREQLRPWEWSQPRACGVCVVGGGDVCQRAPRWAWMRSCLTRLAAPPAAASSPPSIPASTESFLLHNTFFSALASPSPGPQMLFPVSAWQTPTYPQPLCEVPPPPAPLARWQGVALL